MALLASLRSRKLNGQTVGVMITASHNPPGDNGIKLVDPMGEMLEGSWEAHATALANAPTDEALAEAFERLTEDLALDPDVVARAVYARDTRSSGPHLVSALLDGFRAAKVEYTDYKLLTTPQLHYITRCMNTKGTPFDYGEPTEKGYYEKTARSFQAALGGRKVSGSLTVDCANGVGGPKLSELLKYLPSAHEGGIDIKIVNDNIVQPERLNHQVHAYPSSRYNAMILREPLVWSGFCENQPTCTTCFSGGAFGTLLLARWRCRSFDILFLRQRVKFPSSRWRSYRFPGSIVHR